MTVELATVSFRTESGVAEDGQVQVKIGKGITLSQAGQLIPAAQQVQAVLGC